MDHNVKLKLEEAFDLVVSNLSDAKSFVKGEVPDIAREFVRYGIASAVLYLVVSATILIGSVESILMIVGSDFLHDTKFGSVAAISVVVLISFICTLVNINELLHLVFAPKVYAIECFKNLLLPKEESSEE